MSEKFFKFLGASLVALGICLMHLVIYLDSAQWAIHGTVLLVLGTITSFMVFEAQKVISRIILGLFFLSGLNLLAFLKTGELPYFHLILSLPAALCFVYIVVCPYLRYRLPTSMPHF